MAQIANKKRKDINSELKTIRTQWKKNKLFKQLKVNDDLNNEDNIIAGEQNGEKCNATEKNVIKDEQACVDIEHSKTTTVLHTLSIAVPGSILDNAQSAELRTYLAGQIARAACIYNVDEIIVFNDTGEETGNKVRAPVENNKNRACLQLARILQYLECPQYLRKHIFPLHKDLQYAGLLNPLDAPHHLLRQDEFPFREGIVSDIPSKKGQGSFVDVGLYNQVKVDKTLIPKIRVTVKILQYNENIKKRRGIIVPPSQPRSELGVYWGYNVRVANSLSDIFTNTPHENGYDLCIGTSDKGKSIDELFGGKKGGKIKKDYRHCVIVFGGLHGLESALECDEKLTCDDVSLLFDLYVNTCPKQGSRAIRTEEAILISLAELRTLL